MQNILLNLPWAARWPQNAALVSLLLLLLFYPIEYFVELWCHRWYNCVHSTPLLSLQPAGNLNTCKGLCWLNCSAPAIKHNLRLDLVLLIHAWIAFIALRLTNHSHKSMALQNVLHSLRWHFQMPPQLCARCTIIHGKADNTERA